MAYRFLLEVPESLAAQANIAVGEAEDAQVVVVRNSHGREFDDSYVDLTIAAHSLRVIQNLYDWFDDLGASLPDIRLVLHSGERLSFEAHDRGTMVSAIRRDQPWVERTIPRIGEHAEEEGETAADAGIASLISHGEAAPAAVSTPPVVVRGTLPVVAEAEPERQVAVRELNHIALRVTDLAKAEQFYVDFFAMDLLGRARRAPRGGYRALNGSYTWEEALRTGQEADVTFLRNGPLALALQRLGRGARLERSLLDHISFRVDATTYTRLKGEVLMRSYELIASAETAFAFRDPFGFVWEVTLQSDAEMLA